MNRLLAGALALCLAAVPGFAQQAPAGDQLRQQAAPVSDGQLQQLMIRRLTAELDLVNAASTRREADWAQYAKPLWQMPADKQPPE